MAPYIWVFLDIVNIHGSLLFCDKKCKLLFVCPLIVLLEIHMTLLPNIYFCFSFNGVLSSPLGVAQLSTKSLRFDSNKFCLEIGRNFKWNIFLGINAYNYFIFGPRSLNTHAPFGFFFYLPTPPMAAWVEFDFKTCQKICTCGEGLWS